MRQRLVQIWLSSRASSQERAFRLRRRRRSIRNKVLVHLKEIIHDCAGIRRAGSAAIDLAYTACGRFDGFWEYKLFPWDYSAGVLLVREAGGTVTDFTGVEDVFQRNSIIAGNKISHPLLLEKVLKHFSSDIVS